MTVGAHDDVFVKPHLAELAMTAAEFHQIDIMNWVLVDAKRSQHEAVRRFIADNSLFDVLGRMPGVGPARFIPGSFAEEFEDELSDLVLEAGGQKPDGPAELLISRGEGRWDMADFNAKVMNIAPVLVIVESPLGICGGLATVPFRDGFVADPTGGSFLFELGPPVRYPLKKTDKAICAWRDCFMFGDWSLVIRANGCMDRTSGIMTVQADESSWDDRTERSAQTYAVPESWRTDGRVEFTRFEVWRVAL